MNVLIFGCGYLGSRAAGFWRESGSDVFAVTRTVDNAEDFQSRGLHPIVADITQPDTLTDLPVAETVLFAVGFDRKRYTDIEHVYVDGLKNVLDRISEATQQFVYISSTGVYGDAGGNWVDETTTPSPLRPGGKACLKAERLIRSSRIASRSSILRLAGIYGRNRIPRMSAVAQRDWAALPQNGHLNLIHVDDAASIILEIVSQRVKNELLLISDGNPPTRREYYEFVADQLGTGPIKWGCDTQFEVSDRSRADKKISNRKLIERTAYSFKYPDYKSGVPASLNS